MNSVMEDGNVVHLRGCEQKLNASERRYRELFEFAPISLWEEDWSGAKKLIDRVRAQGVDDFRRYFKDHPDFVARVAAATRYLDVNEVTLPMYGASDKRELLEAIEARERDGPFDGFSERILDFAEGQTRLQSDYRSRKLDGTEFDLRITISIPQEYQDDWSRVLVAIEDVTAKNRAEKALSESEALLRAMFDNTPFEITVNDIEGRYIAVNKYWQENCEINNAETKIKGPHDFFPRDWGDEVMLHHREVLRSGKVVARELEIPSMEGSHTYLCTKFPILSADGEILYVGTIQININDRKRGEAAVARSEKKYRQLVELAPYLTCIHESGKIKYINPAGAQIFGADSSSILVGREMEDLIHPDSLDLVNRFERQAREKRIPQPAIEVKAVRLDGQLIDVEISFIPFDDPMNEAVQIIGRDITEKKLAKEILNEPSDYRKDISERLIRGGAKNLFDRELLQLILFPVHRRRNVKALAERLLNRFGDFGKVISADPRRLADVPGTGNATIVALKATQEAALRLIRNEIIGRPIVGSWKQVLDYLSAAMAYNTIEQFRVLFLDRKNVIISDEVLQDGTLDHAPIYPRQIIKRAIEIDASALVLVHNHPSGDPKPSHDDIEMTKRVIAAGKSLGIEVHDHVVIGKGSHASFRSMGLI